MEEQFIGSYRVIKKIGAGGMSRVYLAVHQDVPNLKVILKILSDPRLGERFRHEADKLALLDGHPNICRIKHFFSHGEDTVIAMEYIEGIAVDEKIEKEGKLSTEESLQIIVDLLDILDFAHQKGIYHRDIKPGNIMIDKKGQVKIIDFGIAKAETDPNLTVAGTACGTPAYMAPEQFTPTQDTNYALVDVYAAGTTLYVMLTGETPFKGDNEFAIRDAKLFSKPVAPRSLSPNISKQVEEIIMKSLAKDPARRFQSALEMRAALDAARRPAADRAVPGRPDVTIDMGRPRKRKARKPLSLAVAGIVVLVLAASAIYYFAVGGGEVGTLEISVMPHGDVYVDDSLLAKSVAAVSLTCDAGRHVVRVYNEEATDKTLYDTVWLAVDTLLPLTFDFTAYIPPATGTINISVTPRGDIYVDDSLLGRRATGASLTCGAGTHSIRVENDDAVRKTRRETIWLGADEVVSRTFQFTIRQKPPTPPPEPEQALGEVVVVSKPRGADVYINGELQEQKTPFTFSVKPGKYFIKVKLTIDEDEVEQDSMVLVAKDSYKKILFDFE